jgi:uncharacterized protein YebE (UPF0316 family)
MEFFSIHYFDYILLPVFIFVLRVFDVTLDTMRIIFMTRGYRKLAPLIGFFEVLTWIVAITRIMQNLNSWVCYVAYAGGFAMGNYVGMRLDEKLAIGHELIRVITKSGNDALSVLLRNAGFGVTVVKGSGMQGEVDILYVIVNRKNQQQAIHYIRQHNPDAFFTVENIHFVNRPVDKNMISGSGIFASRQ